MKSVSLRSTLLGDIVTFLGEEDMECTDTQSGLVDLISQLAHYKEEGQELFPEVFIVDDLDTTLKVLSPCTWHKLGTGEKGGHTMKKALKKCAPLTEGSWSIIIHRTVDSFDFGICQTGLHSLSVSIADMLIDESGSNLKVIYVHQVAERLIELRGANSTPILVSFSSQNFAKSPIEGQLEFAKMIVAKVPESIKEQCLNFFKLLLLEALQHGHGTLACIISSDKKEVPKRLQDGSVLETRIDIASVVQELDRNASLGANRKLEGCLSLALGMLNSDGITVFTDAGEIVAYNIFINHSNNVKKNRTLGGARSRTFMTLSEWIGKGIEGAYIQSQDGAIQVEGNDN